ncbi:hypothetical protein DBR32_10255 [Taibaiella sp. KBW10]|nr:hypothetical protein DBR32_10255 [Taibaiella sp. KBW10]
MQKNWSLFPDRTNIKLFTKCLHKLCRHFVNMITDAIGYNSYYRGGYINQIDAHNFAFALLVLNKGFQASTFYKKELLKGKPSFIIDQT